jgi:predicted RecA/RadA family phage recombinase
MAQATFVKDSGTIDHTPASAVNSGDVIVQGWTVGIAKTDIAANVLGALAVEGEYDIVKATGAILIGGFVFWDADGDPVGGTSGTGAAVANQTLGNLIGHATVVAASGDTTVRVRLAQYIS